MGRQRWFLRPSRPLEFRRDRQAGTETAQARDQEQVGQAHVSVRARLVRVLDLTDGRIRSALRISERRILDEAWREEQTAGREALTQALGRIGHELGWEAFLVPSAARRGGMNLIIFPTNLSRRSSLDIINVGELPRRG